MEKLRQVVRERAGSAGSPSQEGSHWTVGGRYRVLRPLFLFAKPSDAISQDPDASVTTLRAKESVLVLALQTAQTPSSSSSRELSHQVFLANTHGKQWICGWGLLCRGARSEPAVASERLPGSWQKGGRYRIAGRPVLRASIGLNSAELCHTHPGEEVLILDLSLVLLEGQVANPRFRARVHHFESGKSGWLTVELPGGAPLLEPVNLLGEERARQIARQAPWAARRSACRRAWAAYSRASSGPSRDLVADVDGGKLERKGGARWEVDGKYITLARTRLRYGPDLESTLLEHLAAGTLVNVREIREVRAVGSGAPLSVAAAEPSSDEGSLRLRVDAEKARSGQERLVSSGWISGITLSGDLMLDLRDHLEYEKLLKREAAAMLAAADEQRVSLPPYGGGHVLDSTQTADQEPVDPELLKTFSIELDQSLCDRMGMKADYSDGRTIKILTIGQEGLLAMWNSAAQIATLSCAAPGERRIVVQAGDRIVRVNGHSGDAEVLMRELAPAKLEDQLPGTWIHSRGEEVTITRSDVDIRGVIFTIESPHSGLVTVASSEFIVSEDTLKYFRHTGVLQDGCINWSNGSTWTKTNKAPRILDITLQRVQTIEEVQRQQQQPAHSELQFLECQDLGAYALAAPSPHGYFGALASSDTRVVGTGDSDAPSAAPTRSLLAAGPDLRDENYQKFQQPFASLPQAGAGFLDGQAIGDDQLDALPFDHQCSCDDDDCLNPAAFLCGIDRGGRRRMEALPAAASGSPAPCEPAPEPQTASLL